MRQPHTLTLEGYRECQRGPINRPLRRIGGVFLICITGSYRFFYADESKMGTIMVIDTRIRTIVGADLSCTSPIYRPSSCSPPIKTAYTTYPGSNVVDFRQYTDESAAKLPPSESPYRNSHLAMQTTDCLANDEFGMRLLL